MYQNRDVFHHTALISSIKQDSDREMEESYNYTYTQINAIIRRLLWGLCYSITAYDGGIPAQACRLLERYFFILHGNNMEVDDDVPSYDLWQRQSYFLTHRYGHVIVASILTALKMVTRNSAKIRYVNFQLRRVGFNYRNEDIMRAEFEIFKVFNFRLPLDTSLEKAEILCYYLCLPVHIFNNVQNVLNIAEFRRDILNIQLKHLVQIREATPIQTIHLVASAIYVALVISGSTHLMNIYFIEKVTHTKIQFIMSLAQLIMPYTWCLVPCY